MKINYSIKDKVLLVNSTLKKRLIFFFVMFIFLAVIFVFVITYNIYSDMYHEKLFESNSDTIKNVGMLLESKLHPYIILTLQMAINNDVRTVLNRTNHTTSEVTQAYQNIGKVIGDLMYLSYNKDLMSITLCGKDNSYVFGQYDEELYKYSDAMYDKLVSGPSNYIIIDMKEYNFLSGIKADCIGVARMIKDNSGNELGYVVILIKKEFFSDVTDSMDFNEGSFFYVFSEYGELQFANKDDYEVTESVINEFHDIEAYNRYDKILKVGENRYYVPLYNMENTGWTIFNLVPLAIEQSLYKSRLVIIFLCTFFIVIAILVAISIALDISNPISALITVMRNIGKGDLKIRAPLVKGKEMNELYSYFNTMIDQISRLIETNQKNQKELLKSELSILQAQINPHFIYNTLNSIRWIAIMNHQIQIKSLVDSLSILLKGIFKMDGEFISLDEEMQILTSYADVMKVRYRNFKVVCDIDEELLTEKVMKFMLQPIIENSIIHGFKDVKRTGEIIISARRDGNDLFVLVKDNGKGISAEKQDQIMSGKANEQEGLSHIGIYNVHKRIQLHFGEEYGVSIESNEPTGTIVRLKVKIVR